MAHFNKMTQENLITIIWVLSHLHSKSFDNSFNNKKTPFLNIHRHKGRQNKKKKHKRSGPNMYHAYLQDSLHHTTKAHKQTAYMSQHELSARNSFPASNLEKGWIIDSGASAHMTPFRKDCINIRPTYKLIYLADGSTVMCKFMGNINIPIVAKKKELGTLILEDVLIVPNLDRRLFSVNAFLSKGHNWVHFTHDNIKLGIRNGPSIDIPITSLQANAMVVDHTKCTPKYFANNTQSAQADQKDYKKIKITTNTLHDRLHRSDGVLATVQAHNLWRDAEVTQGIDTICTSCKIMTIPAHARGKSRTSIVSKPLDEIQVDTVPNPEPMGLSADTRYNYFLIFCDRYSRLFRICGIRDKSTDACIDGIELIISNLSLHQRTPHTIRHVRSDAGSEFRSDTFRKWCSENKIQFTSAAPKHQEQNGLVERHWGTIEQ